MATNPNLRAFDALGKLDDLTIRARGLEREDVAGEDLDALQLRLLVAQLACVEALRARGLTARAAIALVVLVCEDAADELERA